MWISQQHCLMSMIEKRKEIADNGGEFDAFMTDLSKRLTVSTIDFDIKLVKLIQQYLSNRKQGGSNAHSSWKKILWYSTGINLW